MISDFVNIISVVNGWMFFFVGLFAFAVFIIEGARYFIALSNPAKTGRIKKLISYGAAGIWIFSFSLLTVKVMTYGLTPDAGTGVPPINNFLEASKSVLTPETKNSPGAVPKNPSNPNKTSGVNSTPIPDNLPVWLQEKMKYMIIGQKVKECLYRDKSYLLQTGWNELDRTPLELFDGVGNHICYPTGGMDGHGDRKCLDFQGLDNKETCRVIWEKQGTPPAWVDGYKKTYKPYTAEECVYDRQWYYRFKWPPYQNKTAPYYDAKGSPFCGPPMKNDCTAEFIITIACEEIWRDNNMPIGYPGWAIEKVRNTRNGSIKKCKFPDTGDTKDYYYYVSNNPDDYNLWLDRFGQYICAPSGGITGRGDGKCPSWVQTRSTCDPTLHKSDLTPPPGY